MADPLDALVEVLTAREREKLSTNPWFSMAQGMSEMPGYNPRSSTGTNIGAGFIKGFLGNYAGNRAIGDYRKGLGSSLKVANDYLSADPSEREAIIAANPELGEEAFYLRQYGEQEKRKERDKQRQFEDDLSKLFVTSKLKSIVQNPGSAESVSRIKLRRGPDGGYDIDLERPEPIGESIEGGPTARKKRRAIAGVDLPVNPLDEVKQIGDELAMSNIPRASAGAIANNKFSQRGKADDRFAKDLEENYRRASSLTTYLDETGRLLKNAGETGGPGWAQALRDTRDYLFDEDQYDDRKKLSTFDADTIRFMRVPGAGTTSDKDLSAYIKGGITDQNRPDVNADIHARLSRVREKILEEYGFMSLWMNKNQTYQNAPQVLAQFNEQFPMFVDDYQRDEQGNIFLDDEGKPVPTKELNPDRPDPREWLAAQFQQLEAPSQGAQGVGTGDAGAAINDMESIKKQAYERRMAQRRAGVQ